MQGGPSLQLSNHCPQPDFDADYFSIDVSGDDDVNNADDDNDADNNVDADADNEDKDCLP